MNSFKLSSRMSLFFSKDTQNCKMTHPQHSTMEYFQILTCSQNFHYYSNKYGDIYRKKYKDKMLKIIYLWALYTSKWKFLIFVVYSYRTLGIKEILANSNIWFPRITQSPSQVLGLNAEVRCYILDPTKNKETDDKI